MDKNYLKLRVIITLIIINLIFHEKKIYAAVDQILNDNFFQNPAELSLIKQVQLIAGNLYMMPTLKFTGATSQGRGQAISKASNSLPYLLTAYRLTKRFVVGVNITPSAYGHIQWSVPSFVNENSTTTKIFYYRAAIQSSYEVTDNLSLGIGANLEYNKLDELDMVVPHIGNQINKVWDLNHTLDFGFFYKINPRNDLNVVVYTPINNVFGHGTSSLGPRTVYNYSSNIVLASVASIGLKHTITDKWSLEEKIYWSGWNIGKNVFLINKTNGTTITPANWRNVWSFQANSRYATTDKIAFLVSLLYETNPVPTVTNQIGYPLGGVGSTSIGLDLAPQERWAIQLLYGYGAFMPQAKINNSTSRGRVSANFQAFLFQITYKT